jgi:L-ascorbate metabolism protein UlaG (beta-lactamase superfamily)
VRIRWYGQSAFLLAAEEGSVVVDPFGGDIGSVAQRGLRFDYPPIEDVSADLVLVTHEHFDHNVVEVVGGSPTVIRSTAGRRESPLGEVLAVASEHDDVAGTARGPNTIFCFTLDGLRVCHMGDFGQPSLRPEQREAIGELDVLFVPVGDGPTIGGQRAVDVVRALAPRLVVPMHYRTPLVSFLEPPDAFLDALGARVERLEESEIVTDGLLGTRDDPTVVLFAPPSRA